MPGNHSGSLDVNRRGFLKASTLLAGATALGFSGMFGLRSASAAAGDDPITILNVAATAETFACTHYYSALKSNIVWTQAQLDYIRSALEQELIHLEFLNTNGGNTLAKEFYFPTGVFNSRTSFGTVSAIAETVFVGAYLAATRRFAELGNSLLAATAAQVAVIEGQHLALVRQTALELPNNLPLAEPSFYNVSDAVPVVQPLLDGKVGALGQMDSTTVAYPGADAIRKLIGKTLQSPVKTFVDPTAFPNAAATPGATESATGNATEQAMASMPAATAGQ